MATMTLTGVRTLAFMLVVRVKLAYLPAFALSKHSYSVSECGFHLCTRCRHVRMARLITAFITSSRSRKGNNERWMVSNLHKTLNATGYLQRKASKLSMLSCLCYMQMVYSYVSALSLLAMVYSYWLLLQSSSANILKLFVCVYIFTTKSFPYK